jgi:hypothetical protein
MWHGSGANHHRDLSNVPFDREFPALESEHKLKGFKLIYHPILCKENKKIPRFHKVND